MPIIVFMLTVLIKSAPGGDGRGYSWGRERVHLQVCAGSVGPAVPGRWGQKRPRGQGRVLGGQWPLWGPCLRWHHLLCPVGGAWARAGLWTGSTPSFLRLPSLPWGVGGQDAGWDLVRGPWFLVRGAMGDLLSSHRPSSLDLRLPDPLVLGPPVYLLSNRNSWAPPTCPPHTLCLFPSHHNSYVPHLPQGGTGPSEARIWARGGQGLEGMCPSWPHPHPVGPSLTSREPRGVGVKLGSGWAGLAPWGSRALNQLRLVSELTAGRGWASQPLLSPCMGTWSWGSLSCAFSPGPGQMSRRPLVCVPSLVLAKVSPKESQSRPKGRAGGTVLAKGSPRVVPS